MGREVVGVNKSRYLRERNEQRSQQKQKGIRDRVTHSFGLLPDYMQWIYSKVKWPVFWDSDLCLSDWGGGKGKEIVLSD